MTKPYAESCEQNQHPILTVLKIELKSHHRVLEIASGTGQHAVFFGQQLPQLEWQTSDLSMHHAAIQAWIDEAGLDNVLPPVELDVRQQQHWQRPHCDAVFSANAVHIMSWSAVKALFTGVGEVLKPGGKLILYGPFNYQGRYTSDSNARFDQWLKQRDEESGIRDFEQLNELALQENMSLHKDYAMPANNRILVWQKP